MHLLAFFDFRVQFSYITPLMYAPQTHPSRILEYILQKTPRIWITISRLLYSLGFSGAFFYYLSLCLSIPEGRIMAHGYHPYVVTPYQTQQGR